MKLKHRIGAVLLAAAMTAGLAVSPTRALTQSISVSAESISDLPANYQSAADWIWNTRIQGEKSVEAWDTIYDKIVAGNGTLHYVVKWHSYDKITLEQRQKLQGVLETAVNAWTDWLVGYENWPYQHVNVKIVGWAVIDESCLLDRQPDEVVYTQTQPYDPTYDIQNGMGDSSIPTIEPVPPTELFRYEHWRDPDWDYGGSYENRYDMHLQATQGMIDMGGYGYYWGQQLSSNAVLGLADGTTSVHILEHEVGHGFGFTDFYGAEGASDGYPVGGFPVEGGGSIMMAGSSAFITDFDGWFARYVWTKIAAEPGRFDLSQTVTEPSEEMPSEETPSEEIPSEEPEKNVQSLEFTDTITGIGQQDGRTAVTFSEHSYAFDANAHQGDEQRNIANYEVGDTITVVCEEQDGVIVNVKSVTLVKNVRDEEPAEPDAVRGDVNDDGVFDLRDLITMQKWLLGMPDITLKAPEHGDLIGDGVLDVYDLVMMKRDLLYP